MISVYKKELRGYFTSLTGYVATALILVLSGIFIKVVAFDAKYSFIENVLPSASVILLLAVPIITMSSFAGERAQKTDALLYSLPLSTAKIVLGKYFAMLTVFLVPTAVIAAVPAVLSMYGTVNYFNIYSALIMFFLLIAAMTAICMFMSSVCESQIIAAVLGSGALLVCYFATLLTSVIPKTAIASLISVMAVAVLVSLIVYWFTRDIYVSLGVGAVLITAAVVVYLNDKSLFLGLIQKSVGLVALFDRFAETVSAKVFDLNTAAYYVSIAAVFTVLTSQTAEKRRYS